MENKRYFWLKLKESFFDDDIADFIEKQTRGKDLLIFYLKLCCMSLKNGGLLVQFVGTTKQAYDEIGLARATKTNLGTVQRGLRLFLDVGIIEEKDGGFFLTQVPEMTGSETATAERVRKCRALKKSEQKNKVLHCNNGVTPVKQNGNTDIEIEKELELDSFSHAAGGNNVTLTDTVQEEKKNGKPSLQEVKDYVQEAALKMDAAEFFDYNTAKGWTIGGQPVSDWRAACRAWARHGETIGTGKKPERVIDRADKVTEDDLKNILF